MPRKAEAKATTSIRKTVKAPSKKQEVVPSINTPLQETEPSVQETEIPINDDKREDNINVPELTDICVDQLDDSLFDMADIIPENENKELTDDLFVVGSCDLKRIVPEEKKTRMYFYRSESKKVRAEMCKENRKCLIYDANEFAHFYVGDNIPEKFQRYTISLDKREDKEKTTAILFSGLDKVQVEGIKGKEAYKGLISWDKENFHYIFHGELPDVLKKFIYIPDSREKHELFFNFGDGDMKTYIKEQYPKDFKTMVIDDEFRSFFRGDVPEIVKPYLNEHEDDYRPIYLQELDMSSRTSLMLKYKFSIVHKFNVGWFVRGVQVCPPLEKYLIKPTTSRVYFHSDEVDIAKELMAEHIVELNEDDFSMNYIGKVRDDHKRFLKPAEERLDEIEKGKIYFYINPCEFKDLHISVKKRIKLDRKTGKRYQLYKLSPEVEKCKDYLKLSLSITDNAKEVIASRQHEVKDNQVIVYGKKDRTNTYLCELLLKGCRLTKCEQ